MNNNNTNFNLDKSLVSNIEKLTGSLNSNQLKQLGNYLISKSKNKSSQLNPSALTILYGSQTGNSHALAKDLHKRMNDENLSSAIVSMGKFKEKNIKDIKNLLVIVSTQGEGDPPDDALNLVDYLNSNKAPKLTSMNFGVLALGDTTYEFYCKTGKDFDSKLEELGANRVIERVDLDVDYEEQADIWINKAISTMKPLLPEETEVIEEEFFAETETIEYTKQNPLSTKILTNQKITGRFSEKNIRHIEIDLDGSGLTYAPGDSLGVWFSNDEILVKSILNKLNIDPNSIIQVNNEPYTIYDALIEIYELTLLHPGFVEKYADLIKNNKLKTIASSKDGLREYIKDRQVIDVISQFPSFNIKPKELTSMLRKLTPRLYSIASSQAEVEEEVHLTVSVVEYDAFGFKHLGGASGHLYHLKQNEVIKVYTQPSAHFRLPVDSDKPIIMIGPGTGIAPFRSFMQERVATEATGKNWLFFGNPYFTEDFLYQTEWQDYLDEGSLNHIDLAFSRDQKQKIYVQDRIIEKAKRLWEWIQNGAHIYVCGDKDKMAKDVETALLKVIQEQGNFSKEAAKDFLKDLQKNQRYQKDVY